MEDKCKEQEKYLKYDLLPNEYPNILDDNEDELGTKTYAETLINIIKGNNKSLSIALFGRWGSGKTTIVKTLQKKFSLKNSDNINFCYHDVWKHSGDALYRSFLIEFCKANKLDTDVLQKKLYQIITTENIKLSIDPNRVFYISCYFVGLWFILGFIIYGVFGIDIKYGTATSFILTTLLLSIINRSIVDLKSSEQKSVISSSEEFEQKFKNIITKIKSENKNINKFVIVFDNIDRCRNDIILEILKSLKIFCEIKDKNDKYNIIIILPLDRVSVFEELKKHKLMGDEYISKIFDLNIDIKSFDFGDFYDFAKKKSEKLFSKEKKLWKNKNELLNKYDDAIEILSGRFVKNVRDVIRNLNALYIEYRISKDMEKLATSEKSITENLNVLAKFLLLKSRWPLFYEAVKTNPQELFEIEEKAIIGTLKNTDFNKYFYAEESEKSKEELKDFFLIYAPVKYSDPSPFFFIKDKYRRKGLLYSPQDEEIKKYIISGLFDKCLAYLKKNKDTNQENLFEILMIELKYNLEIRKSYGSTISINILIFTVDILCNKNWGPPLLSKKFEIKNYFFNNKISYIFYRVGIEKIIEVVKLFGKETDNLLKFHLRSYLKDGKRGVTFSFIVEYLLNFNKDEDIKDLKELFNKWLFESKDNVIESKKLYDNNLESTYKNILAIDKLELFIDDIKNIFDDKIDSLVEFSKMLLLSEKNIKNLLNNFLSKTKSDTKSGFKLKLGDEDIYLELKLLEIALSIKCHAIDVYLKDFINIFNNIMKNLLQEDINDKEYNVKAKSLLNCLLKFIEYYPEKQENCISHIMSLYNKSVEGSEIFNKITKELNSIFNNRESYYHLVQQRVIEKILICEKSENLDKLINFLFSIEETSWKLDKETLILQLLKKLDKIEKIQEAYKIKYIEQYKEVYESKSAAEIPEFDSIEGLRNTLYFQFRDAPVPTNREITELFDEFKANDITLEYLKLYFDEIGNEKNNIVEDIEEVTNKMNDLKSGLNKVGMLRIFVSIMNPKYLRNTKPELDESTELFKVVKNWQKKFNKNSI